MKLIEKRGRVEIWHDTQADEFYVYGVMQSGDPRVVPSLDMARAVSAGY